MPTASRGAIWTVYFIVFVDLFQFTFIFPLVPMIVKALAQERTHAFMGTPAQKIGLLASAAAGAGGVAAPYLGRLADRVGRRTLFVVAQAGGVAANMMTGLAPTYAVLLLSRILDGVTGGTAGVAAAYIADVTSEAERPGYMSYYMAASFLGLSTGPAIGGLVSACCGWRTACFAAAGVCAVNLACTAFFLPDSSAQRAAPEGGAREVAAGQPGAGERHRRCCGEPLPCSAWPVCSANFLASLGWTAFEVLAVLYIEDCFFSGAEKAGHLATVLFSRMVSVSGLVGLAVNLFIYALVEERTGLKGSIALGGVLKAVGFWGIAVPSLGKWAMFVAVQVVAVGDQLQSASIQTLITRVVAPTQFGEAMGQMTLFGNVARTAGPLVFSRVYETGGRTAPWLANILASLLAAALCVLARLHSQAPRADRGADAAPSSAEDTDASMQLADMSST